jgi:hypothetical protein
MACSVADRVAEMTIKAMPSHEAMVTMPGGCAAPVNLQQV